MGGGESGFLRMEADAMAGDQSDDEQVRRARVFEAAQHAQSWKEAIRRNPKALLWCAYSLFTCIMWGYDGLASSVCVSSFFTHLGDK